MFLRYNRRSSLPSGQKIGSQPFQFLDNGLPGIYYEPVQTADIHVQPPFLLEFPVQDLTLDSRYSLVPQLVPCLPFPGIFLQALILGPAVREVAIPLVEPGGAPGGPLGTVKADHHIPAVKNLPVSPALGQRGKGHGLGSVHAGDDNMHMQLQSRLSFTGFCLPASTSDHRLYSGVLFPHAHTIPDRHRI